MYELHLLIDGEGLLGEVGQKTPQLCAWSTYLLRYRAMGSAGLLRRSRKKPEKLKAGSGAVVGECRFDGVDSGSR